MNGENKYQVYSYDYSDAQGQQFVVQHILVSIENSINSINIFLNFILKKEDCSMKLN